MASLNEDTDEGLVARIQKGDHQSFAILVRRHTDKFYGLAWRLLGNDAEADDVVQDAFLKLWTQPDLFRIDAGVKFTTWFYRVVSNMALDKLRGRKRWAGADVLEAMADNAKLSDQSYEDKEMQKHMEQSIAALPERQKLALTLCFYEGVSVAEAAQVIGVGEKAVESLLMRAKSGVRNELIRRGIIGSKREDRHERTA
jgi:RNA polymerase sigma-70 factor (ECF subfamily)